MINPLRTLSPSQIRKPIQIISSLVIIALLQSGYVSITTIFIVGSLIGIFLGKVFCRWMCPMGIIMEMMMGAAPDEKAKAMYQYHKIGCPIAWISGLLNRFSIFTVRHDTSKECKDCGICDKNCYISTLNTKFSLFKKDLKNPVNSYTCSRCLACVEQCPTGHLTYGLRMPSSRTILSKKKIEQQ